MKAVVLEIDRDRRRLRLGMKQLEPTAVDHYISEHQPGQTVSGRLLDIHGSKANVELGEGVVATCRLKAAEEKPVSTQQPKAGDLSSMSAMLSAKWKQGGAVASAKEAARAGEVRSFRISSLDPAKKLIELELAS